VTDPTAPDLFARAGIDVPAQPEKRGRGRPKLPADQRLETYTVRLNPAQAKKVLTIGDGNVTTGLRRLVDDAVDPNDPNDIIAARVVDFMHANDHLPPGEQYERLLGSFEALTGGKVVPGVKSNGKPPAPGGVDFDGETYDPLRDYARLNRQMRDVWDTLVGVGPDWISLFQIRDTIYAYNKHFHSVQGISARLRDLRKPKYGRWDVERKPSGTRGLWLYRLEPTSYAARLAQYQASQENRS
jgi:hypothetical protein